MTPSCPDCGKPTSQRKSLTGRCRSCAAKRRRPGVPQPRVGQCKDCGAGIPAGNRTGRCRSCATAHYNALPETREKRRAAWKVRLARPGEYQRICAIARRNAQKAAADPDTLKRMQERGRYLYRTHLSTPEVRAKVNAKRAEAGRKASENRLAWCPPEFRELHRSNMQNRMTLAESRAVIEKLAADREAVRSPDFDAALFWLNRYAPTSKRDDGTYRHGNAVLTAGEVMARAKASGWKPERIAA